MMLRFGSVQLVKGMVSAGGWNKRSCIYYYYYYLHPGRLTWNITLIKLKGTSSSKPSFSGSMLIFGGVYLSRPICFFQISWNYTSEEWLFCFWNPVERHGCEVKVECSSHVLTGAMKQSLGRLCRGLYYPAIYEDKNRTFERFLLTNR